MSLNMKQSKLASKDNNKPSQGTNKPVVRDSNWSSVSALTRFIMCYRLSGSCRTFPSHGILSELKLLRAPRDPFQVRHPLMYILALTILATSFCFINNVSAAGGSMTVTISDNVVDLNVSPSTNGTFAKSDATTIGVSTTNATGYTLSLTAQAGSNPTSLINGTDNTKMFPSIQSAITEEQFKSLNPSSIAYNNMWGYLPSKYNSQTNTSFLPSPTTDGDILDITSEANSTINEYEITVGARVDTTATLGTYSNVLVVDVIANMIPYTITYYDNVVGAMPTDVTGETEGSTVTISSNVPTRVGYTFEGWCTVAPTLNANGIDTCPSPGTQVNAGGTLNIDQTGDNNNFQLYAMWRGNYTIQGLVSGNGTMQDLGTMPAAKKAKIIASMAEETNYTLKDSRDNQSYTIAKLKDGQIWMTKNLNLAGGTTLTYTNTDFDYGYILPTANGFQSGNKLPTSSTSGFSSDTMAYVYNSGSTTCANNSPCYSYYSWVAATAGSGVNITTDNTDAPYSICPKGWKLPSSMRSSAFDSTLASFSDFYNLAVMYGMSAGAVWCEETEDFYDTAGDNTIPNFLLNGRYDESAFYMGGVRGYYNSSTSGGSNGARYFLILSNYVDSSSNSGRHTGRAVRCILK